MSNKKIWVEEGFQTSINIAYDLHNEQKIKSFIPTLSSIDIIEDVLLSTSPKATNRSRILIGAYGKGKSHIVLMLMSLLSKKDRTLFDTLLNKIETVNPLLFNYINEYLASENRLLPIIVSGSSASLTQSFLSALQQALKNENLLELMPETNFKAAIATIRLWETDYKDTFNKFEGLISTGVEEFIISLKQFDIGSYEKFNEIFPQLTSGTEFNPFANVDVVELYESTVAKLKDVGFNGVYIVYDEFSKYLESSISNATISDIKLLQDFAEKCDRSTSAQMHLLLISHKDIANYIDKKLPKEKVDGWRGVSGRFKHINLHNNFTQMYEIISTVIKKDNDFWGDFLKEHETKFNALSERFLHNGVVTEEGNGVIENCYPLHPVTTFILPRLSEKIAQNERTLFTFLSSDNKHTLPEFLKHNQNDFELLTPDYIYDYFEPLFRKEDYTTDIYKIYMLTNNVLRRLEEDELSSKIIKTLCLIYMVEQFEKLPPILSIIIDTFADNECSVDEIKCVLNSLIEKECIIYLKRSNGYLKIKESSGTDIASEINNIIEKNRATLHLKDILNQSTFDNYIYPTAYNDEMELTRYFDFKFIDSEEFYEVQDWSQKIHEISSVGIVYAVIPKSEDDLKIIRKHISSIDFGNDRVLFIVPKVYVEIERTAYEYFAVKQLRVISSEEEMLLDELDIFIEDLEEFIENYINGYLRPELGVVEYFYLGEKQFFKRKAQISTKLSEICFDKFPFTPVINNETINKDTITTAALNSRNKVISGLLEKELDFNLGLSGSGQDVSIMRSTLIRTGILINEQNETKINLTPDDDKIRGVLEVIQRFLLAENDDKSFKSLYDVLVLHDGGYGIKKGIIPIFIAAVLHSYKSHMVINFRGNEMPMTTDLLNSINENPNNYTVCMENWNEEKSQYISELSEVFTDYIVEKEKDYNTFSYVVLAMNRWYMSLPRYTKEAKSIYKGATSQDIKIDKDKLKYLSTLKKSDINAREYLFEDLVKVFHYAEFSKNLVSNIKDTKSSFDNLKNGLIKHLVLDIKGIFAVSVNKNATLTGVIKDYIESLNVKTLEHLYPNGEDKILALMSSISNDDKLFVERLGKTITNLRLDDWTRTTVDLFVKELEQMKRVVSEFDRNVLASSNDENVISTGYKISFIADNGSEVVKTFDKVDYSNRGKLLFNEISVALEEMGNSIPESEKRQILMSIIEKMC